MSDPIDRAELITQLEGLKVSLGDVVLGFVVDRAIELVRQLPAAKEVTT